MYQKGMRKGTVKFVVKPSANARTVQVAGDFSNWKPLDMKKQSDGQFVVEVPTKTNVCQYKFVVDGQWVSDPDHSNWARNPYGTMNSVCDVSRA